MMEALNRRRGDVRGGPGPPHHVVARARGRHPWFGGSLAPLRLSFGLHLASGKNRRFGLRFVQFREYFLCNFSETQKHQKTGNWHCVISLIGQFRKMHKNATKCNKTQSKWCKNKHGASKIIDTLRRISCLLCFTSKTIYVGIHP
jgi:hypothetical protein